MIGETLINTDGEGRHIRWYHKLSEYTPPKEKQWCSQKPPPPPEPYEDAQIEEYFNELFMKLSKRKKAFLNWKKLQIVFALVNSVSRNRRNRSIIAEDSDDEQIPCGERLSNITIMPESKGLQVWILFSNFFYLYAIFSTPLVIAFSF